MRKLLGAGILAAALSAAALTDCSKPKGIKESGHVSDLTTALIVRINDVLEATPHGKAIKLTLEKLQAPASCVIVTQTDTQGISDSRILCQTEPMPDHPMGLHAIVGPVSFPTTLGANNGLSTIGVHLEHGVFSPNSGCGIYELDATREIIGSNDAACKDINQRAAEIVEEYEQMIDEGLRSGPTI